MTCSADMVRNFISAKEEAFDDSITSSTSATIKPLYSLIAVPFGEFEEEDGISQCNHTHYLDDTMPGIKPVNPTHLSNMQPHNPIWRPPLYDMLDFIVQALLYGDLYTIQVLVCSHSP